MTLQERIGDLVEAKKLPRLWTTADVLACPEIQAAIAAGELKEVTVKTDPNNRSISPCHTSAGANVRGARAAYYRFQPSNNPRKYNPFFFCLVEHYNEACDPATFTAPFRFDRRGAVIDDGLPATNGPAVRTEPPQPLELTQSPHTPSREVALQPAAEPPLAPPSLPPVYEQTPVAPAEVAQYAAGAPTPPVRVVESMVSAPHVPAKPDPATVYAQALKALDDDRFSDALTTLQKLGDAVMQDESQRARAAWGYFFMKVGLAYRSLGELEAAYLAYDNALRWFVRHPSVVADALFAPGGSGTSAADSRRDTEFELAKLVHAQLQGVGMAGRPISSEAVDTIRRAYSRCAHPDRHRYAALFAHLLRDQGWINAILAAMRQEGATPEELLAVESGLYAIVNDSVVSYKREDAEGIRLLVMTTLDSDQSVPAGLDFTPIYQRVAPSSFRARFELLEYLGEGGFGVTHKALDRTTGEIVAIKRLKAPVITSDQRADFEREAKKLALLGERGGVVRPLASGVDDTLYTRPAPFIAMEFMAGGSLRDCLHKTQVSGFQRLAWIAQLCDGLAAIHTHPLLHRDLKPDNIFLTADLREVRIGDLGIASIVATLDDRRVRDAAYGTPPYFAPEQFPPRLERGQRSEIYSMGLIFFEVLTGQHPFGPLDGITQEQLVARMMVGMPHVQDLPTSLAEFLTRCLAPVVEDRFESAAAMAVAFRAAVERIDDTSYQEQATPDWLEPHLMRHLAEWVVDKAVVQSANLGDRPVPAAIKERLVWKYYGPRGELSGDPAAQRAFEAFVAERVPTSTAEVNLAKVRMNQREEIALVDHVHVRPGEQFGTSVAKLPALKLDDAVIDTSLAYPHEALFGEGMWCELRVKQQEAGTPRKPKIQTVVTSVSPFETQLPVDRLMELRSELTTRQWMAFLLRSMGYNPDAYNETRQIWLLTRLVPLVQYNVNLIELAPKGTGKTYVFTNVSRNSWVTAATVTRSMLFVNRASGQEGVIGKYDCAVIDECQSATFGAEQEVLSVLKDYLERGSCTVGEQTVTATTSFVMLGNIPIVDGKPKHMELLRREEMPAPFVDTAFLDRIHGILPGWELPKMSSNARGVGLGLQVGVLAQWLHQLRGVSLANDMEEILYVPYGSNLRDTRAVQRLASGYAKLLFPHGKVDLADFERLCLAPAINLRGRVRAELHAKSSGEFARSMPDITLSREVLRA